MPRARPAGRDRLPGSRSPPPPAPARDRRYGSPPARGRCGCRWPRSSPGTSSTAARHSPGSGSRTFSNRLVVGSRRIIGMSAMAETTAGRDAARTHGGEHRTIRPDRCGSVCRRECACRDEQHRIHRGQPIAASAASDHCIGLAPDRLVAHLPGSRALPRRRRAEAMDGGTDARRITIHAPEDFAGMRAAGRLAAETLDMITPACAARRRHRHARRAVPRVHHRARRGAGAAELPRLSRSRSAPRSTMSSATAFRASGSWRTAIS